MPNQLEQLLPTRVKTVAPGPKRDYPVGIAAPRLFCSFGQARETQADGLRSTEPTVNTKACHPQFRLATLEHSCCQLQGTSQSSCSPSFSKACRATQRCTWGRVLKAPKQFQEVHLFLRLASPSMSGPCKEVCFSSNFDRISCQLANVRKTGAESSTKDVNE